MSTFDRKKRRRLQGRHIYYADAPIEDAPQGSFRFIPRRPIADKLVWPVPKRRR